MICLSRVAMKQLTGWRVRATSTSLTHFAEKCVRTKSATVCFSKARARRSVTPFSSIFRSSGVASGKSYKRTNMSIMGRFKRESEFAPLILWVS